MHSPRLAVRYAKSIIDLAIEQNQLEPMYTDMKYIQSICKVSPEFVNLLRSPIIKKDKKQKIVTAVINGKMGVLTASFITLMINKNREEHLPEIVDAVITQYNQIKGIHKVKLTTAETVSEEMKQSIVSKIKSETSMQHIELETVVKPELVGGFALEFNNNLVDASIARDLRDIKKQFQENIYVKQIR
jgi:F-type H+-transporting ATPase subunit delta